MDRNPEALKSTTDQEADRLKSESQRAAQDVGGTAKDQAQAVTDEAKTQAKSLASSLSDEASSQASAQQERLAGQSRIISDDLQRMSRGERAESDMVNQFLSQAADRAQRITHQLESREPRELLGDVGRFASRRPVLFLAIAAGAGVVAGRLTRGLTDSDDDSAASGGARPGTGHAGQGDGTQPRLDPSMDYGGQTAPGVDPTVRQDSLGAPRVDPAVPPRDDGSDLRGAGTNESGRYS